MPSAIAIVPIPLVPPCTSTLSPSAAKPRSNRFTQTVNNVSGIAAASKSVDRIGHGQAGADGSDAIFGIAAACDEGADVAAHQLFPTVDDLSGDFQPEDVRRTGRRRIEPLALKDVGPVDARRGDLDQHLAGARGRHRAIDDRSSSLPSAGGATIAFIEEGTLVTGAGLLTWRRGRSTFRLMDLDELFPSKPDDPLVALAKQDLDPMSIEELKLRIEALKAEIGRVEAHIQRVETHRSAAEELFKRPS